MMPIKNHPNKMFLHKLILFLCALSLCFACTKKKTESIVVETWDNGKPRKTAEYTINDDGSKSLYKETLFFPGEKKFIEGTTNIKVLP